MKYLILSVVVLVTICSAQAKTVADCANEAKRCKSFVAPMFRNGNSKEGLIRSVRTTPLSDICSAATAFLDCTTRILDDAECNIHEAVSKYQPLKVRLNKVITFICVKERDAIQRAIPCVTTRQFFAKIAKCKRTHACNSEDSWNCAKIAVASSCDSTISTWFEGYIPVFKQNHPGCGEDNLFKKFYGAMRSQ
jgi:hypothetical protein